MVATVVTSSAQRALHRVRTRLSTVRRGGDDGFILLESMIAIALITVIMAAVGVEYVYSVSSASRLRATQVATELADSTIDQIRAMNPSDLVTGRDSVSVSNEFTAGQAVASVAPWLTNMDQISDPGAAPGAGATALVPTSPTVQQPGSMPYQVTQYLGSCQLISTSSGSNCVPAAQVPASQTSTATRYLRVVVSAGWSASSCGSTGCMYVTSTLISNAPDPTFRINQPLSPPPAITQPPDQKNEVGDVAALQLSVQTNTGVPAFSWAVIGSLPNGLSIDPVKGLISGTVAGPTGSQSVTIMVTDGYGRTATVTFTWTVFPGPSVAAPANQTLPINVAASIPLTTTCPNGPCTYSMTNPPTGLTVSNSGVITGTPTVAGPVTSTVTVTDAAGVSQSTSSFVLTIVAPVATCPTAVNLPNGGFETPGVFAGAGSNVGNGTSGMYWQTNDSNNQVEFWANGGNSQAQNGNTPITAQEGTQWAEIQGAGFDTLSQTLSTKPGQVIQWSIWHRARNVTGNVAAQDTMQVRLGTSGSTTAQVPASSMTANISDGASAWVNYRGFYTVPAGQTSTLFQAAAISSSSGSAGAGNFLDGVTVTGVPCMASLPANQTSTVNTAISPLQLTASQGSGNYTWSGSLPAGLNLSAGGRITGTPTATGATSVSLTLTDSTSGYQESVPFTWTVLAAPSVSTVNQTSTVNRATSASVASSCPNNPCTFAVSGQPAGLSINATTGTISGTPTATGTSNPVTVTITDNAGATATSSFTWVVKTPPTISSPANQVSYVGSATSLSVSSVCPNSACTYSVSGAPAGLTINSSTGTISGTPTSRGVSTVTVTITDQAGATASTSAFQWTIYNLPTVTSPGAQSTTVNAPTVLRTTSTCDDSPCSYALSGAPNGLTINSSTGTITGAPTATGTSSARVTITDSNNTTASTTFAWTVYNAPTVTAPSNQSTVNNATVTLALTTTCPNSPCAYTLNGGPAGLTVSNSGVISGRVTSAQQTFTGVTVTVTDSSGVTARTAGFTWTITAPLAGRWTFDEASGTTAADASGSGHTATLSGGYGKTAVSAQGANALTLNGSTGIATASGTVLDTSKSFTVSAWVKLNNLSGYQDIVTQDGVNVSGFNLQLASNNRFQFDRFYSDSTGSGYASVNSVAAPVINQWYQVTGVYDASANTISLYVNGVKQGSAADTTGWNATGRFVIGRATFGGPTAYLNGAVDDVRAYGSALSDDAVTQLAQAAYWTLDDGTGTTAADSSLNSSPGTLAGGVTWTTGIVGSSALQFNGSSGVVTSSPNPIDTSQSFSVSAWAKANSTNSTGVVASADGSNISSFLLRQNNDKWSMLGVLSDSGSTTVTTVTATSSLVVGQWYHLVGVYDSAAKTLALYVNGVLQGAPVSVSGNFKAGGPFVIGRSYYQGTANYFGGAIDDVHAFRFPLDQAGVNALSALTPPTPAAPTATAGSTSATVSWTAPVNVGGAPVTGYVVTPYDDGVAQSPVTYNSTATSQTLTGLSTGDSYTFAVAAVNANGSSAQSARSGAVVPT